MRLIPALLLSAAFGAGAVSALLHNDSATGATIALHGGEDHHAGPDSTRVALLFSALEKTDPVVCDMITDQIGNFWWGDGRAGLGRFVDRPAQLDAAKDSVSGPVTDARAIQRLTAELGSTNNCTRRLAGKMLGHSTVRSAMIVSLLSSADARVRESAAYAAGNRDSMDVRAALEHALDDRTPAVAAMAAWALGESDGDHAAIPALVHASHHADTHVRAAVIWSLGKLHEGEENQRAVLPVIRDALSDKDIVVRRVAAEAYGELEEVHEAPPALLTALASGDAELRHHAAHAVASIADPSTIKELIALLNDGDRDIRKEAIEALGKIGSPMAITGLTRALGDKDREVRKAAVEALGELKDR